MLLSRLTAATASGLAVTVPTPDERAALAVRPLHYRHSSGPSARCRANVPNVPLEGSPSFLALGDGPAYLSIRAVTTFEGAAHLSRQMVGPGPQRAPTVARLRSSASPAVGLVAASASSRVAEYERDANDLSSPQPWGAYKSR